MLTYRTRNQVTPVCSADVPCLLGLSFSICRTGLVIAGSGKNSSDNTDEQDYSKLFHKTLLLIRHKSKTII